MTCVDIFVPANVHDLEVIGDLLHGEKTRVGMMRPTPERQRPSPITPRTPEALHNAKAAGMLVSLVMAKKPVVKL